MVRVGVVGGVETVGEGTTLTIPTILTFPTTLTTLIIPTIPTYSVLKYPTYTYWLASALLECPSSAGNLYLGL